MCAAIRIDLALPTQSVLECIRPAIQRTQAGAQLGILAVRSVVRTGINMLGMAYVGIEWNLSATD
jgi:hypothetical protein